MNKTSEFVAVKIEGPFTEWYAPTFKNPYEDSQEFCEWYDQNMLEDYPAVYGACLGEESYAYVSADIDCLCDRLSDSGANWDDVYNHIKQALEFGTTFECDGVKITPYRKCEMPPVNEDFIKHYGPYEGLMRERVAAIGGAK